MMILSGAIVLSRRDCKGSSRKEGDHEYVWAYRCCERDLEVFPLRSLRSLHELPLRSLRELSLRELSLRELSLRELSLRNRHNHFSVSCPFN